MFMGVKFIAGVGFFVVVFFVVVTISPLGFTVSLLQQPVLSPTQIIRQTYYSTWPEMKLVAVATRGDL